MKLDSSRLPALLDDMNAALREMREHFERDASGWSRGPAGKWTAGQHVEHVVHVLALTATGLERAAEELQAGRLGTRPWRDPLQALFVALVTREPFPSGGKALKATQPGPTPSREQVFPRLAEGMARHRALAERVSPEDADRIWIWNPFVPKLRWHYRLPEIIRVHATHTRHHFRLAQKASRT